MYKKAKRCFPVSSTLLDTMNIYGIRVGSDILSDKLSYRLKGGFSPLVLLHNKTESPIFVVRPHYIEPGSIKLMSNFGKFASSVDLLGPEQPADLHLVVDCLNLFWLLIIGCFSSYLATDYRERIANFKSSYETLMQYSKVYNSQYYGIISILCDVLILQVVLHTSLTITWKVHCITSHRTGHGRGE